MSKGIDNRVKVRRRILCWFSCGAASAVATKMMIKEFRDQDVDVVPVYCDTGSEHADNKRFLSDCEEWFGSKITILKSSEYEDTWDVWERRKYLSGPAGAPCTGELKVTPRLDFQLPYDIHVFGYTFDSSDIKRAKRLRRTFFELSIKTPLIENMITKQGCLSLVSSAGITIPEAYNLGFPNNNCIPCVKSESPPYWAMIRKYFPFKYQRMVDLSRKLGVRLVVYKGKRIFLDELPTSVPLVRPTAPRCDFMCGALDLEEDD